jgi:hypothetical protein
MGGKTIWDTNSNKSTNTVQEGEKTWKPDPDPKLDSDVIYVNLKIKLLPINIFFHYYIIQWWQEYLID